ncbi:hypothetical protein PLACP1_23920 [Planifilum fimeticola]
MSGRGFAVSSAPISWRPGNRNRRAERLFAKRFREIAIESVFSGGENRVILVPEINPIRIIESIRPDG